MRRYALSSEPLHELDDRPLNAKTSLQDGRATHKVIAPR
jgi:hypothetical protein